jgi:hypothetical protein
MNLSKAFNKKKLITAILLVTCGIFNVQALEVDQTTKNLILDSISLELVSNSSLKDPTDNLPLGVDFDSIDILGMSIELDSKDVNLATYTYHVLASFETVDGYAGTLLCSAFYTDNHGVMKASKAVCMLNSPVKASQDDDTDCEMDDDICMPLDNDGEVLIDEL